LVNKGRQTFGATRGTRTSKVRPRTTNLKAGRDFNAGDRPAAPLRVRMGKRRRKPDPNGRALARAGGAGLARLCSLPAHTQSGGPAPPLGGAYRMLAKKVAWTKIRC